MSQSVGSIHYDLSLDTSKFDAAAAGIKAKTQTLGQNLTSVGSSLTSAGAKLSIFSVAAALIGGKFISLASDLQTTERRMGSLAGSTEEARKVFGQLYNYVLGKPIAFPDASKAAATLMGYGVEAKKVVGAMKTLSAFSIVNGADMQQLALAYGQVNAKGKLMGQEIIQLTNNFVPVADVIAKHFNVSVQEAMELMEGGKVSAEEFNKAMANFIPQEEIKKQSDTFKNRMISLQGSIRSLMLGLLGVKVTPEGLEVQPGGAFDRLSELLPKIADGAKRVGDAFKGLSPEMQNLILGGLALAVALGPILIIIGSIATGLGALATPAGLVILAIGLLIAALAFLEVKFGLLSKAFNYLRDVFNQHILPIFNTFAGIINTYIVPVLGMLWSYIEANLLPALKRLWDQISPLLIPALKILAVIIGVIIVGAIGLIVASLTILTVVFTYLVNGINWGISVIKLVFGTLFHAMTWPFRAAYAFITGGFDGVRNMFSNIGAWLSRALGNVFGSITAPFRDAFNWIMSQVNKVKDALSKLNPLKRSSPSLVDHIKKGTSAVIYEYGNMFDAINHMALGSRANLQGALARQGSTNSTVNTSIYGNISIGSQQDADYFLKRLSRNQELELMGLSPL